MAEGLRCNAPRERKAEGDRRKAAGRERRAKGEERRAGRNWAGEEEVGKGGQGKDVRTNAKAKAVTGT